VTAPEIRLYGWDTRGGGWHGPNELNPRLAPDKRLLQSLQAAPAGSWYGPVSCCAAAEPATRFFILIHDLADCAVASVYDNESKAGPAEILAVVPASRRSRLREDFAFEFLAFARFLNAISPGAELEAHDGIAAALADAGGSDCVFSISSDVLPADLDPALSRCAEKIAVTLCRWLGAAGGV
jgi:hypothetical protein